MTRCQSTRAFSRGDSASGSRKVGPFCMGNGTSAPRQLPLPPPTASPGLCRRGMCSWSHTYAASRKREKIWPGVVPPRGSGDGAVISLWLSPQGLSSPPPRNGGLPGAQRIPCCCRLSPPPPTLISFLLLCLASCATSVRRKEDFVPERSACAASEPRFVAL